MREMSIELLNKALADELSAVHQYMYFHFRLDDQGYHPLAALLKRTAIQEMQHAEALAERILFLGGEVLMQLAEPVQTIHEVRAMLEKAKEMEQTSIAFYNDCVKQCAESSDAGSKKVFEGLVQSEEAHWDTFDRQVRFIEQFGESYLALQSFESAPPADHGA